jgi:hypothetical protein
MGHGLFAQTRAALDVAISTIPARRSWLIWDESSCRTGCSPVILQPTLSWVNVPSRGAHVSFSVEL